MRRPWMVPLVPVYAAGAALRWSGVKPQRLGWPVVSVGNLSAGGTGKTPFTIALAGLLRREGFAADVLSRGYGRQSKAVERVDPAGNTEEFGDEPLLIAREARVPVFVGSRRWEAGVLAEAAGNKAGPSTPLCSAEDDSIFLIDKGGTGRHVHLLDDGFQHRQLARDVDIVLVNSEDLGDWLLPAGNLREGLGALRRASVLAVPAGDDAAVERLRKLGLKQPVWRFRREMVVPEVDGPVYAFCGIARPEQFFLGLERAGMTLAAKKVFRDHYAYRAGDVRTLEQFAERMGARGGLVTTEKDQVRMGDLITHPGQIPLFTAGLRIVLEEEAGVAAFLRNALGIGDGTPGPG